MEYEIVRSDRRSIAIEIKPDGRVLVRAPRRMTAFQIRRFVKSKENWIKAHVPSLEGKRSPILTASELESLREQTRTLVTERCAHFAPMLGVTYGRIAVRAQRTRWGSCSSKENLNFNLLLALMPPQIVDYVVVHELCHLRQMNHSPRFWELVASILPDYNVRKKWLKDNGPALIARLPNEKGE